MHRQFIIQRNNKAEAVVLSKNNKLRRRDLNLYLLTGVDYIIHTADASECAVIGYMMDGQARWPPIPLGNSSIYLHLFFHSKRHSNSLNLPKVE